MKVSDFIASFLADRGISHVFVLTGGCIVHAIDSVARHNGIDYLPCQHEQSAAMAADAYARISGNPGVAFATSGPGATNLLTGVCCSYYDSIPVLLITGQVPRKQLKGDSRSRQIGFQETDVVSIFAPVTKYANIVQDASEVRYELEKAWFLAREGRPGPVLLDICDDVQRAEINPAEMRSFEPEEYHGNPQARVREAVSKILDLLKQAKRPVVVFGGGIRCADASREAKAFIETCKTPFTLTWGALDCLDNSHNLFVGGFGVTSGRAGNFAIQNADLIICVGTRLDTHEVGSDIQTFARGAKRVIIDIDPAEQEKYAKIGWRVDLLVTADARAVLDELNTQAQNCSFEGFPDWNAATSLWREKYPVCLPEYYEQLDMVNPYVFMRELSAIVTPDCVVITDCGSNLIWTMQAFEPTGFQRVLSAFNHSPMGYALPAAIGAAKAAPDRQIICIIGDGGLQINIQELATIHRHKIPIKIFVMNNHGHGIIQGTQDTWLAGRHHAANPDDGGLPDPDFYKIAAAYGLRVESVSSQHELKSTLDKVLGFDGPVLCDVHLRSGAQISPKLLFGKPIEDSHPLLPRDEFKANMMIEP